jgi:anti-sigma factor RsiW
MVKSPCKWVRARLPLWAGDDLLGGDRRRVERHLLVCPACRRHRAALERALGVLRAAAGDDPGLGDARSLWPELQREIRESRRRAGAPSWTGFGTGSVAWPRLGLGLGLALELLATVWAAASLQRQLTPTRAELAAGARLPIAPRAAVPAEPIAPPAPSRDLLTHTAVPPSETAPSSRLEPDLERATLPPDPRSAKPSY